MPEEIRLVRVPKKLRHQIVHLSQLKGTQLTGKIFFLDSCVFENNIDAVEEIVMYGNFRVTNVTLKELKDWNKPGRSHPLKRGIWERVQAVVKEIESKWPDHIETVSKGRLYAELTELDPLLSKTIAFNRIFSVIDRIIVRIRLGIDKKRFAGLLRNKFAPEIEKIYLELCRNPPSGNFTIVNEKEDLDIARENIKTTIESVVNTIDKLVNVEHRVPEDVKRIVKKKHENKTEVDKLNVVHFLESPLQEKGIAVLAAGDKDLIELISMHRRKKAA
jgi:hypothetical protein